MLPLLRHYHFAATMNLTEYMKEGMLSLTTFRSLNLKGGYDIVPVVSPNWKNSEHRLLIVLESLDRQDIRANELLSQELSIKGTFVSPMTSLMPRLLGLSYTYAKRFTGGPVPDYAVGFVNFNAARTRFKDNDPDRLSSSEVHSFNSKFANRTANIIQKLRPTHVLVCGFTAMEFLRPLLHIPEQKALHVKSGWIFDGQINGLKLKVTQTLDLEPLYNSDSGSDFDSDDDSDYDTSGPADLFGFVSRNIANLITNKHHFTVGELKPKPIYVDTLEKFKKLTEVLKSNKVIAIDTETRSLETFTNAIYMIQFAVTKDEGWVLPLDHPKSPFSQADRETIKGWLRKFFATRKFSKELVFLNGAFDLRIVRSQIGVNFIHHDVYETTAGEQSLDENMGLFSRSRFLMNGQSVKLSYQNLRNLLTYRGSDYYWTAVFSKEERGTLSLRPPDDPEVLDYASMDVQCLIAVRDAQIEQSKHTLIRPSLWAENKEVFYPYFIKHVTKQMRNTVVGISHMEQSGSPVDLAYIQLLGSVKSPLKASLKELEQKFRALPNVKEAEKRITSSVGKSTQLFGGDTNFFSMNKKDHLLLLFLGVLGLEPPKKTSTGQPSIDKNFVKAFGTTHKEVQIFGEYVKVSKLMSTYVKGWYKKIVSSVDAFNHQLLIPSFGFFTIVTGRLNSFDPSLQQIPNRGSAASIIKRAFAAPVGHLNIKYDYNAAEVRMAAVLAKDKVMASSFAEGARVKRLWIFDQSAKIKEALKRADVHVQSVHRFFDMWVDKSHPLRDAIKAIIFGLIYGKSVKSLAKDLALSNISRVEDELIKLTLAISAELDSEKKAALINHRKEKEAELKEFQERDWVEYADGLQEKLFTEFSKLSKYLNLCADRILKDSHVTSPIGRVRNLFRILVNTSSMNGAARRRAQNAPIQGISSEIGSTAGYLILKESDDYITRNKLDQSQFPMYCRAVHDANNFVAKYEFVIPLIHIMSHQATTGAVNWYESTFGMKFNVHPEVDIEIGAHDKDSRKWDYSMKNLAEVIVKGLIDQVDIGRLEISEVPSALATIYRPWIDVDTRRQLQANYPILGIPDLDAQIVEGIKHAKFLFKEWSSNRKAP